MRNTIRILFISIFVLAGCADFHNSPFTDQIESVGDHENLRQQERLFGNRNGIVPRDDLGIKIALVSDNHNNYNDIDAVVGFLNQRQDLDFVVHTGDMTNSGYNFEYDAFIQKFSRLDAPAFAVIGNHDAIGKGRKIYRKYFGDFNYSFVYQGYHFIFFNNNRLEFIEEGWSLDWLKQELSKNSHLPKIVFQHINYDNADAFPAEMSAEMKSLYENAKVQWVINGHRHVYGFDTIDGVRYAQVPRMEDASYLILSLQGGEFQLESYKGGSRENISQGSLYN